MNPCNRCGTDIEKKFNYCVQCNEDLMAAGRPNARVGLCVNCGAKETEYDYCKKCNDERIAIGRSDMRTQRLYFRQCKHCDEIKGSLKVLKVRDCKHVFVTRRAEQLQCIAIGDCGTVYGYVYEVREYAENTSMSVGFYDSIAEAVRELKQANFDNGEILRYARSSNDPAQHPWITAGTMYRKVNGSVKKL